MYRGTTPTLKFRLSVNTSEITLLSVAIAQNGKVVVEKALMDCTLADGTIACLLTEEDTLALRTEYPAEIQLRIGIGEKRFASQVFVISVGKLLRDGVLDD